MPNQKRKVNKHVDDHVCKCFDTHETQDECENQSLLEKQKASVTKHRGITAQIIAYSKTVQVLVGEQQKQAFLVHRDLLTLHSSYFSKQLKDKGLDEDCKISVPVKPTLFVDFISWIYFGEFLQLRNKALEGETSVDPLWELGRFLEAPAFQNFCIDDCRNYCKTSETDPESPWPFVNGIKLMYSVAPKGSRLRKLALDSLTYKNPLQMNKKGSAAWKKWKDLLTGQNAEEAWKSDLREDFTLEAGKDWEQIAPWDDRRRNDYVEKEIPLEERWEAQIVLARNRDDIKRAALKKIDIRSIIEWEHLQRSKNPRKE